ncbi:MAG TPA: extensin family protein [Salinarimonas sp.]|nr:extensin family protein [Salinarimonas sp.]
MMERRGAWTGRLALAVLMLALAGPATAAGEGLPTHPPLPPPRPADLGGTSRAELQGPPIPADPEAAQRAPMAEIQGPPIPAELLKSAPPSTAEGGAAACRERLARLGVAFEPLPPISAGACGAPEPVRVKALSDALPLSAPVTMTCPVAEALARWAGEAVAPAAEAILETRLKRLAVGTGYECRGRRGDGSRKLSEHAFANAVDIMGFEFERGPAVTVAAHPDGSAPDRFQDEVRAKACAYFTTVIGPGTDAAHANHLHLDLKVRKRGASLCQ